MKYEENSYNDHKHEKVIQSFKHFDESQYSCKLQIGSHGYELNQNTNLNDVVAELASKN